PMQLRYKVFIIDEAHQLSSDAKDAFLKTLEEPPANVVFILATTEPQAIPITIRSRCQQFDFKRGSMAEITSRLRYVLDCEGVSYTPDAVSLVARGAEGSYRDSLSLLEQVLAFTPTQVTAVDVETVLGSLDAEMLSKVVYAVSERNAPETFALAGQILDAGKEARTLLRTLSLHFRDLMLVSVGGPAVAAEMTPDEVQRLQAEARLFTPPQMMKAMDILNEAQGETRWNNQHRLLTELTFLKLMNLGGNPGEGREFLTAPIVFAEGAHTNGVSGSQLVSPPAPPTPRVITPPPVPVVVSVPAPVVVETVPQTVAPGAAPPPPADDVRPILGEREGKHDDILFAAAPGILASSDVAEVAPSYFAADPIPDDDEIEDYGFPPIGDDDAPDDLSDTPTFVKSVVATAAAVATADPVAEPVAEAEPPADTDEWKLFADDPQPGPGLFDDASVPVAKLEPPPTPTPPEPGTGETQNDPRFPTSRERTQQPPALSLENAEEIAVARGIQAIPVPAQTVPARVASSISDEGDDGGPPVTIAQVRQVWATFLSRTERISQGTYRSLKMAQAEPTQVVGRVVIITFHNRQWYEMLDDNPKVQAFIKKLLAHVLQREAIGVRLELDPTMVVQPRRTRVSESRDNKKRYDRIAAITAQDTVVPAYTEVTPTPAPFGFSGGQSAPATTSPAPLPAAASAYGNLAPAPLPRERPSFSRESAPETPYRAQPDAPLSMSATDKRAIALAEPLVQEVLTVFGGDIVLD
ncbi:MAG: hypothetical protein H7145_05550, partial [Akkermansiaceae bacterium]|nr:hypothetical protein [Armatimonadota bacterium]